MKSCMVRVGDLDVSYVAEGPPEAPVVMLAHGILTSHEMWEPVVRALTPRWRVVRYDLRGHGATSSTAPPYCMEQLAQDAVDLLDVLGIDRVHFIGTSLGGMIGQQLAARFGERLHSATLANTTAVQPDPAVWQQRIDVALAKGIDPLVEGTLQRWFTSDFQIRDSAMVEKLRGIARQTSVEGFAGCAAAIRDLNHADILKDITLPTLVLAGALDVAIPPAESSRLAQAITGAQFVRLPAAHQAAVECPNDFVEAWTSFVASEAPQS
ncbi:alpha/beta fold hydrolase [Variovorax sp. J22P271]|uniref:alpha/beta fold hydrolase n=1 Tax=Variovorax davisae TaxID=3053515 RepID=UPI00257870C2|nr:alpha/beta fold hydrolase [Variovorax sp. J22P271]MDM0037305.1 alpha/beta fold hydrolase [Variovorax sp. J22P271]